MFEVNIKFSNLLVTMYALTWLVFLLSAFFSPNTYGSGYVLLAFSLLGAVQCFAILLSRSNMKGFILFCALVNYVFIFLRVTFLSFFPESAKYFGTELEFDAIQIAETILFVTTFLLFFYMGLFFQNKIKIKGFNTQFLEHTAANNFLKLLAIGISPVIFNLYLYYISGSGRGGDVNKLEVLFSYFFHQDVFVLFTVALTSLIWSHLKDSYKLAFKLWCIFFIIAGIFVGSKGHIYTLILSLLFIKLAQGDFSIRISLKGVLLSVFMLGFGFSSFLIADAVRYAGQVFQGGELPLFYLITLAPDFVNFATPIDLLKGIARRMSHFEYIVLIINNTDASVFELINFKSAIGWYFNFLMPGTPFPDAPIASLQLMKVAYEGFPIDLVLQGKGTHGDYIPFPGLFLLLFGWVNALIVVFLTGAVLGNLYSATLSSSSRYSYLLVLLFWICVNILVNDSFGLDHFLQKSTIFVLTACLFIVILRLLRLKFVFNKR